MGYAFDAKKERSRIRKAWREWAGMTCSTKFVLGVSGGKDSTFLAYEAKDEFGAENVWGVTMPNGKQADIADSMRVIEATGINHVRVNIAEAFSSIGMQIPGFGNDARINLPPRLRMATLFAVAQTVGGTVLNTSNLTEDNLGYCTLFGDDCGSYAPIQAYTVTEVIAMGDCAGIPYDLMHKVPTDGLCGSTDEEKLGMKYADVDKFIRLNLGSDEFKAKVLAKWKTNKFKTEIIKLNGPQNNFPDYVRGLHIFNE